MADITKWQESGVIGDLTKLCEQAGERIEDAYELLRSDVRLLFEDDEDLPAEQVDEIADELCEMVESCQGDCGGVPDESDVAQAVEGALDFCRLFGRNLAVTKGDD